MQKSSIPGKLIWTKDGVEITYIGEISCNDANGKGEATYSNGRAYSGEWKHGKPHGQGSYEFNDGTDRIFVGEMRDGEFYKGKCASSIDGKPFMNYDGEFKDLNPHGYGTLLLKDMFSYTG